MGARKLFYHKETRGDVILEMAGVKVGDFDALRTAISKIKIGQKATVVVLRGKKKMTLKITMGSR